MKRLLMIIILLLVLASNTFAMTISNHVKTVIKEHSSFVAFLKPSSATLSSKTVINPSNDKIITILFVMTTLQILIITVLIVITRSRNHAIKALKASEAKYRQVHNELKYHSYHDQLTGLFNRRFFQAEMERLDHPRNLPLSIVMGDLNGLKLTNDAFGHETGDLLLIAASKTLKSLCRADDIVSRWGGDEFIFILPNTSSGDARHLIKRIHETSSYVLINEIPLSFSLGTATKTNNQERLTDVIAHAENVMYKEKLEKSSLIKTQLVDHLIQKVIENLPYQKSHVEGIQHWVTKVAQDLHMNDIETKRLLTLAKLHDIGLIGVDPAVVQTTKTLSSLEWEELKKHCEIGYHLIAMHPNIADLATDILAHHENVDGTGYPKGLVGDAIPLNARILRICDSIDAMLSDRHYKKSMSYEQVIEELVRFKGRYYDEKLVDIILAFDWPDESTKETN